MAYDVENYMLMSRKPIADLQTEIPVLIDAMCILHEVM